MVTLTGGLVGWPTNYWRWSSDPQPWIPNLVPNYIKQVPIDPKNCCERPFLLGNYEYAYSSNGKHYNLVAALEDRTDPERCEIKQYFWVTNWGGDGNGQSMCTAGAYSVEEGSKYVYAKNDIKDP